MGAASGETAGGAVLQRTPKEPSAKAGAEGWRGVRRKGLPPGASRIDETLEASLPDRCPYCGGQVEQTEVRVQYQTDIPQQVQTKTTRFQVHVGRCQKCRRRVQGRHPRQTSDGLGAFAHQIGSQALALATDLNKEIGVSHGRLVLFFQTIFGLRLAKATLVRGIERLGQRAAPLYRQIQIVVRRSTVVYPDETSRRANGQLWWLWDFVCSSATLYAIRDSRGYAVLEQVLGRRIAACWCMTDGVPTTGWRGPRTRPVPRTYCAAAANCWRWPPEGRRISPDRSGRFC